jgi:malate dehydrogenase
MVEMEKRERFKIACVGAGNVGATAALYCADMDMGDIVMFDVVEGLPQGKALDLTEAGPVREYSSVLMGTNDYADIAGSHVVIVTAGLPRKPGMTRLDLVEKNGQIINEVSENIARYAPNSVVIMVTNPLDIMAYLAFKKTGFPPERVLGMAGTLDSARLRTFVAMELQVSMKNVDTMVLGSHGDDMVPLPEYTTVSGIPITKLLTQERIGVIVERTRQGGGEIVSLLKAGSAYFAPGASIARMVEAIRHDEHQVLPCSAYLDGQYGLKDIYIGVPVVLGRGGIHRILEVELSEEATKALHRSAEDIRKGIDDLRKLKLL